MTFKVDLNLWRSGHKQEQQYTPVEQNLSVDLLVIGGGFTGCSAALEAAKSGANVALVEANTIGHGGSGRNVGLVNAGLWLPPYTIVKALGERAGKHLITTLARAPNEVFSIIEEHGIKCSATHNGTLHLAHSPLGVKNLRDRHRQGKQFGATLELLNAAHTTKRTGSDRFYGALFDPRAGTIQPLAYCLGLAASAKKVGARLFEYSCVKRLSHNGDLWLAEVNGQTIKARHVLQGTNAYQQGVAGVAASQFVTVNFSQYATPPLSQEQRSRIFPGGEGAWDTALVMSSIRVDESSRLVIGGIGDIEGPCASIHENWAHRKLAYYYPEFSDVRFDYKWSGKIAMTNNHLPRVITMGPNGLSIFGYSGRGIGPGTVFGKQAARALLFGETENLPVAPSQSHQENVRQLRGAYYELGSTLTHALRPFPI